MSAKQVDLANYAEQLVNLTVKQVSELIEILKTEHGIEPMAAAAPVVVAGNAEGDGEAKKEDGPANLMLTSVTGSKLAVVKLLKDITGLGLKEAKALIDNATLEKPQMIKEKVDRGEIDALKAQLEEVGAQVIVK